MALNKTFTCSTIIDENNNDINCWYQGFHVRTGTWNDVRYSDYNQYSCNLGDGDWLTQTGEVFSGDKVILVFWNSVSDLKAGIKERLCSITVTIDSKSTYINDVQLRPKMGPMCGFRINDNTPTINNELIAYDLSTDDTSYEYNSITHYQHRNYNSELLFDSIGNQNLKYDWDEGSGWNETNKYTYSDIGDYDVSQQVTNQYDLNAICTQPIRVKYNSPVPGIIFDYTPLIHTTETATIKGDITDINSRITNIKHKIIIKNRDSGDLIEDITEDENTWNHYDYDYTILILQRHFFTQVISWNDGFEDLSIYYNKELPIENWCPEVSLIKIDSTAMDKTFAQTSSDLDGVIEAWVWKIFFIPPFSTGDYVEVYREDALNGDNFEVGFTVGGSYKVQIQVQDDMGCKSSDSLEFEIAAECPESVSSCISNIKFIFPKQLGHN